MTRSSWRTNLNTTRPRIGRREAALLLTATMCVAGCGDDSSPADSSTGAQASSSEGTGSTGTDPSTSSTSSPVTQTSTGSTTSVATSDSSTSGEATESSDTEASVGNCIERPELDCPSSPGAISTEHADVLLQSGSALALDVRGTAAFSTEHIPGATVLSAGDLRATVDGVPGQVAPAADAQMVFEAAGISPSDALVVYDDNNGTDPARVAWTLAYYGHTGPVWMLDGGFDQWNAELRDVESGDEVPGGSAYPTSVVEQLWVDEQWVLDHLDDESVTLVDARSDGEFSSGHIPGALSVDWVRNLGRDGLFLPTDELRALYGDPEAGQTLVSYCQTGSRASVDCLVLTLLGYDDVRIYDGSWSEWSANPTNPVE